MANPPAAPGYGKRSSSKARKREADRQQQPAAKLGSNPAAGTGSPASNQQQNPGAIHVPGR